MHGLGRLRSRRSADIRARRTPPVHLLCHDTTFPIWQALKSIYSIAEFSSECLVISLLYIERLRSLTGLHLLISNWQPILLAAMVVAQKVWDDKSLLNIDFSMICSAYSLRDINNLEMRFLELIQSAEM